MKKVAVMLDGGFVLKSLKKKLKRLPTAKETLDFSMSCINNDEELLRIYYYDCPPYGLKQINPLSGQEIDFSARPLFNQQKAFQDRLSRMDHIAFRRGVLGFYGWKIGKKAFQDIVKNHRSVEARDLVPDLKQKEVDIKIGLDIAWLASKSIVDRLILVTGDTDFIPAMKFARREGVQVVLITLGNHIKPAMREHVDEFRRVNYTP